MMKSPLKVGLYSAFIGALVLFISACKPSDRLSELRSDIHQYIDSIGANVGVAVLTNEGDSLTVNNEEHYAMMSVFKFHQAIAVADYLATYEIPLSETIHIYPEDVMPKIYSPLRDQYPEGNVEISISDLLKYTLQKSDNLACDILFDRFYSPIQVDSNLKAKTHIKDFQIMYNEVQMNENPSLSYLNWSTPFAIAQLISQFCNDSLVEEPYYTFIRQMMIDCPTGQSRLIQPLLDSDVIVGHKTGSGFRTINGGVSSISDVGFLELSDGYKYSVAVFVQDSIFTFEEAEKIISDISRLIFENFDRLKHRQFSDPTPLHRGGDKAEMRRR